MLGSGVYNLPNAPWPHTWVVRVPSVHAPAEAVMLTR
jgi:hypothetical protein